MIYYSLLLSFIFQWNTTTNIASTEPLNLTGIWEGTITQDDQNEEKSFHIKMYLEDKNGKITGTSIINGDSIGARIEVTGNFKEGLSLLLRDSAIQESTVTDKNMEWCLKNYILLIKRDKDNILLEGHWHGKTSFGGCTPGRVFLKRGTERA